MADNRAVTEVGLHWEGEDVRRVGGLSGGLLLYDALGNDDLRVWVRPRLRYRFHPDWSSDISAGLLFAAIEGDIDVSETGFTGGLALHYRDWLSLKTDCHVVDVRHRPLYGEDVLRCE